MFIINFFFKILTRVKYNYVCSHLLVRLGEADKIITLFFYFSHIHMCLWQLSASVHSAQALSIGLNLMNNFSGTGSMEFHQYGWFFRYQTNGIPSNWLIFQVPDQWNSINLVIDISKRSVLLHFEHELGWTEFLISGTPQQWISRKKTEKITFKKIFFITWNWCFLENRPYTYFLVNFIKFTFICFGQFLS